MIRVGICGIGFMGWIHYLAYRRVRGVKLVAVSDPIQRRLAGDWRDIKGNFGPPGEMVDLSGVARYSDYHDLFADPNVDLVDLCLPPAMHAAAAVAAAQAGKHVLCEKPMALTTADCRRMVEAAEKARRLLCIGHVLQFFPEYACAIKLIRSGKYGQLLGGTFKRVISDPVWMKDFYDPNRCGGPLIDLHIHDAHLIRLLFGMPTGLVSCGRMHGEVVGYCQTQFQFSDPTLVVSATSGVIQQQGRVFTHGFEMHLEKATLHYEFAALADRPEGETMPLKVLTAKGDVVRPQLGDVDSITAFAAEITEVVRTIKANRPSALLDGDLARDAIILCHKQTESVKKGRPVRI
jgi:predicted dehydrogenase